MGPSRSLPDADAMRKSLVFDLPSREGEDRAPGGWLRVALLLTVAYLVFGLVLIGVPGLSRGGIVIAALSATWMLVGVVTRQAIMPRVLLWPLGFFAYLALSGFFIPSYPGTYVLQLFTIWVGAVSVAFFVANGVSMNVIIAGFLLVVVSNLIAISVGYDGQLINIEQETMQTLQGKEIKRYSGLVGQSNVLVSLTFSLSIAVFLLRRRISWLTYVALLATSIGFMVLSGSRSALVLSIAFAGLGALLLMNRSPIRTLIIIASGISGIALAVFFSDPNALNRIEQSWLGEVVVIERTIATFDDAEGSSALRGQMAKSGWELFLQQPLIGHGPDQYGKVSGMNTYAHNNFAEISVNWGLIGLGLYYAMYVVAFLSLLNSPPYKYPMFGALVLLILTEPWFVTFVDRGFMLCLALLLVASHPSVLKVRAARERAFAREIAAEQPVAQ